MEDAFRYIQSLTDRRRLAVFQPHNISRLDLEQDDALILGELGELTGGIVNRLDLTRQKVIGCNAQYADFGVPYIGVDNQMAAQIIAEHFIENRLERCVFDSFRDSTLDAAERWATFKRVLEDAGMEAHMVSEDWGQERIQYSDAIHATV